MPITRKQSQKKKELPSTLAVEFSKLTEASVALMTQYSLIIEQMLIERTKCTCKEVGRRGLIVKKS